MIEKPEKSTESKQSGKSQMQVTYRSKRQLAEAYVIKNKHKQNIQMFYIKKKPLTEDTDLL